MNPFEFKHAIAGQPYRFARRYSGPIGEDSTNWNIASLALGAVQTAGLNLAAPATLIQSGFRGNTYLSHINYVKNAIGYPMPMFNYVTPGSSAEKFGARLGGRLGAGVMSHVPPFSWYDPSLKIASHTKASWRGVGAKAGAKMGARVGGRLIPGVGWGLLAYDVYDIAVNRSLWGFDL
jgi:hypothetical protein